MNFFDKLPKEIVLEIFKKTSDIDKANLPRVCKRFKEVASDPSLELAKTKNIIKAYMLFHEFEEEANRKFSEEMNEAEREANRIKRFLCCSIM